MKELEKNYKFIISNLLSERQRILNGILYYSVLAIIIIISFIFLTKNIDLKLAYNGFGPHDYVSQKMNPENYTNNFPNFIEIYDNSLVTYSYYFLKSKFNIDVSLSVKVIMFLQIVIFVFACAFLINTLFGDRLQTLLSILIIMMSGTAGLDLARFGNGYASFLTFPLFYGYATAFGLFAIAFFLKNRNFLCFIILSLSFLIHQNIALFFFAFIMMHYMFNIKHIKDKWTILGLALFISVFSFHTYTVLSKFNVTVSSMPFEKWLQITKIFCFHWYPFAMDSFTVNGFREFFPILIVFVSFFLSLGSVNIADEKHKKILAGILACLFMTIAGVIISEYIPSPLLIKLALHRASGIMTFISVLYIIHYLYLKIIEGSIYELVIALSCIVTMYLSSPGIAIFPIMLLGLMDINKNKFGPFSLSKFHNKIKYFKIITYLLGFLFILLALINMLKPAFLIKYYTGIITSFQYINPSATLDFFIRGGTIRDFNLLYFYIITVILILMISGFTQWKSHNYILIIIPVMLVSLYSIYKNDYQRWYISQYQISKDFFDVQIWAKYNTPPDSLFMIDPSHCYGWRDFSQRSSFGNLREWLWFPVAYVVELNTLNEGIIRAKEFGVDLDNYLNSEERKTLLLYTDMNQKIQYFYYRMNERKLKNIIKKYKVNYIVMNKELLTNKLKKSISYENRSYLVYWNI